MSAALDSVTARIAPATVLAEIQMAWPEAAGAAFAASTQPTAERDGVVTVACVSGVWAQELDLMSERVLGALNAHLGRTAVVRLRPVTRTVPR